MSLSIDAGVSLPGEPALQVAASVWLPAEPERASAIFVCLPGGNMNRGYFSLCPPRERDGDTQSPPDDSYSFAAQMTARGHVVAALDHLGIGGSSKPEDGYALTPDLLTRANVHATAELLARLREGRLVPQLRALPQLKSIGLGHSMGAMMTVLQQAAAHQHDALALLGFSTRGLPEYVSAQVRELADDVPAVRARLVELCKTMFPVPYPVIRSSGNGSEIYGSATAEAAGILALKAATSHLLAVPAFLSLLPGNVAPEAVQIDVPLFLGLGDRDMAGPPHQIPAAFPKSADVTLSVLPQTGHSHFLFASRKALFDRLAAWAGTVTGV